MARKGDILRSRRRVGFLGGEETLFVVLQADALNATLPTIAVAPITPATTGGPPPPLSVPIHVPGSTLIPPGALARIPATGPQPRVRFDPAPIATVDASTLAALERALTLLFDL